MKDTKRKTSETQLLVIDSSVAVKWLNRKDEELIIQADTILKNVEMGDAYVLMPELGKYEVGNALLNKRSELALVALALEKFFDIPIQFVVEDIELAKSTMEIAKYLQITYYDASFIALALVLKADLVTDNPKHQKKKINGLKVLSLKDYH